MVKNYVFKDITIKGAKKINMGYTAVDGSFVLHTHDLSELVIITSGSGSHYVNNHKYPTRIGDVFVITDNTQHGFTDCNKLGMYNIEFDSEYLENLYLDIRELPGYHSLFILDSIDKNIDSFSQRLKLNHSQQQQIFGHIDSMQELVDGDEQGKHTLIYAKFLQLIILLSKMYNLQRTGQGNSSGFSELLAYVETNFRKKLYMHDLEKYSGLSIRQIDRLFKKYLEQSPTNYIKSLRLEYSYRLLNIPYMSIMEIAMESGFSDSNYYIKSFKKKYGITPGSLRKEKM